MSVTKKFCEVEEGLLIGRVSINANTGEITTDGHVNIHSLNLNDNFVVSHLGNAILDGTLLVNSNVDLESLDVLNNTTIGGTLYVSQNAHFQSDLKISGGDLTTTNSTFNLLNTVVDNINFGHTASNISIGKSGDHWVTTNSNLEVARNLSVGYQFEVAEGKFQFDGVYGDQGATRLQGILEVGQQATFEDNVNIGASLFVDFNSEITGYLKVFNNFNVNDKFTVAYATGNTVINGTQNTKGAVDFDSTLNVDGNTTLGGTLGVTGNTALGGTLDVTGNTTLSGTLDVTGNFTAANINVNGIETSSTLTKIKSTNVEISDTIVYLGTANTGSTKDIGFIGHFNNGTYQHTGVLRDATDNTWKFFSNAVAEITDTVDVAGVVYDPVKMGALNVVDTTDSTSISTGSILTTGGLGITKNAFVGGKINTPTIEVDTLKASSGSIIALPTTYKIKSPDVGAIYVPGLILQVKYNNANYNWGSVGHASEWDLTWLDLTLTTKGTNSLFFIASQYSSDDTNSAAYGVGIGAKYSIDGGSSWTSIRNAAAHEDYNSVGSDKYKVARQAFTVPLTIAAGTNVIFRVTGRFNNSNGQFFNGNGQQFSQMQTVMEIAS